MDGDTDYSKYSRAQLEEALTRIDANRYPRNFQNLTKELRGRPPDLPSEPKTTSVAALIGRYSLALLFTEFLFICIYLVVATVALGPQAYPSTVRRHIVIPDAALLVAAFLLYWHLAKHHPTRFPRVAIGVVVVVSVLNALPSPKPVFSFALAFLVNSGIASLAGNFFSTSHPGKPANQRLERP